MRPRQPYPPRGVSLRIGSLSDWLVPQRVHTLGPDAVRRARLIMIFWLVMLPWPLVFGLIYQFVIHLPTAALTCLASWVTIWLVPLVLRLTGRIDWAGNLAVACIAAILPALAVQTGGLQAPALTWLAILPLVAICLAGKRAGICWTALAIGVTITFYLATSEGWLPKSSLEGHRYELLVVVGLTTLQLALFSLGATYEAQKEWALGLVLRREQALSQALCEAKRNGEALAVANAELQREIAERQQIEAALRESESQCREAKEAAEASNRIKSEFLANMSHEIRTPMTAILGYLDLVRDQCQDHCLHGPDLLRNHLHTVRRNGEHLLQIISDILDLSKIEAGKLEVSRVDCSVAAILSEVEAVARVAVAGKGLDFAIEMDGPIPAVIQTDPTRLKQILLNLLSNAVKFTDSGRVRFRVRYVDGTAAAGGDGHLRIEVADTGIGMSREETHRLFRPFSQLHGSTNRKYGGTGLGLAISSRLAESLGGTIDVQSEPGKGTTLTVTIATGPIAGVPMLANLPDAPRSCTPQEPAPAKEKPLLGRRILLAEDGPDNQRLISLILSKAGAEVTVAENGRIAVEAVETAAAAGHPFELILMDMQMPEMDGYVATSLLRDRGCTLPIIAVTAHAMVTDRDACLAAGCDDYASKPINCPALLRMIGDRLQVSSQPVVRTAADA